jgi:hypothetical protein
MRVSVHAQAMTVEIAREPSIACGHAVTVAALRATPSRHTAAQRAPPSGELEASRTDLETLARDRTGSPAHLRAESPSHESDTVAGAIAMATKRSCRRQSRPLSLRTTRERARTSQAHCCFRVRLSRKSPRKRRSALAEVGARAAERDKVASSGRRVTTTRSVSEPTLRTDPGSSPGVCATASARSSSACGRGLRAFRARPARA